MENHRARVSRKTGKFIYLSLNTLHDCNLLGIDAGSANIVGLEEERTYGGFILGMITTSFGALERSFFEYHSGCTKISWVTSACTK
jgi:hypothetical protein